MRYQDEYDAGGSAFWSDEPRDANPHVWHTVEWYAWDAGWTKGLSDHILELAGV